MKTIKSFNLTEEQIERINQLCIMENRSASVIVGMAIDHYYKHRKDIEEFGHYLHIHGKKQVNE